MAHQVLSRKWRPKTFQEVVGQEHITRSLQNALLRNKLGHAYLLTGTRGIGKTTVARIFAQSLRCLEKKEDGNFCGKCSACDEVRSGSSMNIYEIDGASNNSVDDIRELINNVQTLPTFGQYKVYIIDEVHMLSTSAFNALLKTLEEPPEHVVFILATTEPGKLLSTVLSRCQRFDFRNASVESLTGLLKDISKKEKISFENDSLLRTICIQGKGSFRDTLSLLDQVLSFSETNTISEKTVSLALGLAQNSVISKLLEMILNGEKKEVSSLYRKILQENIDLENICLSLLDRCFELIENIDQSNLDISAQEAFWIYETLAKDFEWGLKSISPEKVIEIVLQKVSIRRDFFNLPESIKKKSINIESAIEDTVEKSPLPIEEEKKVKPEKISETVIEEEIKLDDSEKVTSLKEDNVKNWDNFIEYVRKTSPASASNLEQGNLFNESNLSFNDLSVLKIGFKKSGQVFFDYLNEKEVTDKVQSFLEEYLEESGMDKKIEFIMVEENLQKNQHFKTKAEILLESEEKVREGKVEKLENNEFLKEAEEIFKTKIDKIKIIE